MNGRKLFREYAQSKGQEAKEFIEIQSEYYANDVLITLGNAKQVERTPVDYKEMIHWIIKTKKL